MTNNELSLTERVAVLEILMNAAIWGAYLEDTEHRLKIAAHLNLIIEASERHNSLAPNVLAELKSISDGLVQIDALPDVIKPFLRP